MKTISKYVSNDGVEFLDPEKCTEHEYNFQAAAVIMSKLPERPDTCAFSNGGGFIQHDKESLLDIRNEYLEFCKIYTDHKWIQQTIDKGFDADASWAGRILDDQDRFVSRHWYRFMCIDKSHREWGQPFYATHTDGAEHVQLNCDNVL